MNLVHQFSQKMVEIHEIKSLDVIENIVKHSKKQSSDTCK